LIIPYFLSSVFLTYDNVVVYDSNCVQQDGPASIWSNQKTEDRNRDCHYYHLLGPCQISNIKNSESEKERKKKKIDKKNVRNVLARNPRQITCQKASLILRALPSLHSRDI